MSRVFDQFPLLHHSEAVGSHRVVAVFELLQQAAYPNLKEFVQIAGGDGEKLHAFEQRIAEIPSFFEHAPVKFQPRFFAVEEGGALTQNLPDHIQSTRFADYVCRTKSSRSSSWNVNKVERLASCGNLEASYQGIALAMPQALEIRCPFRGGHQHSTFSKPLRAIREVF